MRNQRIKLLCSEHHRNYFATKLQYAHGLHTKHLDHNYPPLAHAYEQCECTNKTMAHLVKTDQ